MANVKRTVPTKTKPVKPPRKKASTKKAAPTQAQKNLKELIDHDANRRGIFRGK